MAVRHLSSIDAPYSYVGCVAGIVDVAREVLGNEDAVVAPLGKFLAYRHKFPMFLIQGDSQEEVVSEALDIVSRSLTRMHRFGFRKAA